MGAVILPYLGTEILIPACAIIGILFAICSKLSSLLLVSLLLVEEEWKEREERHERRKKNGKREKRDN
ncbi:hypothetical protein A2U01_0013649 [Trifolium medium]|uniref:Uncharacterized protein n=1 Tax=Trifolium medium TaxID=97028 RepID=A0A392MYT8_9FABA|nr:hypothetical protein [Trifolium medium]